MLITRQEFRRPGIPPTGKFVQLLSDHRRHGPERMRCLKRFRQADQSEMRETDVIHLRGQGAGGCSELGFLLKPTQRLSHLAQHLVEGFALGDGFTGKRAVLECIAVALRRA